MGILEGEKMTLRYRGEQIHGKVMMENMASRRKVICNSFSFSDWECVTSIFSEHHSFSHSKAKKHYCSTIFLSSISHKTSQNLALIKTICGGEGKMSYKAKKKKKKSAFFLAKCVSFMQLPYSGSDKALAGEPLRQWDRSGKVRDAWLRLVLSFVCLYIGLYVYVYFLLTN